MTFGFLAGAALAGSVSFLAVPGAPGFDCNNPGTFTDRLVCEDAEFSEKAAELENLYQAALSATQDAPGNEYLRIMQQKWVDQVELCQDRDCVERLYDERLDDLRSQAGSGAPPLPFANDLRFCREDIDDGESILVNIDGNPQAGTDLTAKLSFYDGRSGDAPRVEKAILSYSFFGAAPAPAGFVVAVLGVNDSEVLLFHKDGNNWAEFNEHTYKACGGGNIGPLLEE